MRPHLLQGPRSALYAAAAAATAAAGAQNNGGQHRSPGWRGAFLFVGTAIRQRQRELIAANTDADEGTEEAEAALRAADLMARLSARQSAVKLAIRREARKQKALVQYYNTGEMPEALKERPRRPAVAVPAGETPLNGPAPVRIEGVPLQRGDVIELRPEPGKAPLEGAIVMPDAEEAENAPAADARADGAPADGAPMPLRTED